ncbi:MAG TPA: MASE1 domain-containing protein [Vicinamibacterales bacterium]|jgi:two-component system sensor histidine kinase UhpB
MSAFRKIAIFEIGYVAAYAWAMAATFSAGAPLWPPDAVLLGALLLDTPARWWIYVAAALPIRLVYAFARPMEFWFSIGFFVNDACRALLSAYLIRRTLGRPCTLATFRELAVLLIVGAVFVPTLSATVSAAIHIALSEPFWHAWYSWLIGDSLAIMIFVPLILFVAYGRFKRPRAPIAELVCLAAGLSVASWLAFPFRATWGGAYAPILAYAPVPFVVWAIARFGPAGTALTPAIISLFAIWGVNRGAGPFTAYGATLNVLGVQMFLFFITLPSTIIAMLLDERRRQEEMLRQLAGNLMTAQEDERRRISRQLHDDIGQRLAILGMALEEGQDLRIAREYVNLLSADLHHLSRELHDSHIGHVGLSHALRAWCQQVSTQHSVAVDLVERGADGLPERVAVCLYRVAQEALKNAVKHSGAQQISVELVREPTRALLTIRDRGVGFSTHTQPDGIGLASMRERLNVVGGELVIHSTNAQGTEVFASVPLLQGS